MPGSTVKIIDNENTNIIMQKEIMNITLHKEYYEVDVTFLYAKGTYLVLQAKLGPQNCNITGKGGSVRAARKHAGEFADAAARRLNASCSSCNAKASLI